MNVNRECVCEPGELAIFSWNFIASILGFFLLQLIEITVD